MPVASLVSQASFQYYQGFLVAYSSDVPQYWFELTNTTLSPDGIERDVLTVNGSVPGPTIEANWGDTVVIHVTNSLTNNGTGIHWHGIRQNYTNQHDGVPSITQCPIAVSLLVF